MTPACFLIPCPHNFPPERLLPHPLLSPPPIPTAPGPSIQPCPKGPSHTLSPLIMSMGASPLGPQTLVPHPSPGLPSWATGFGAPNTPCSLSLRGESVLLPSTASASRAQALGCPSASLLSQLLSGSPCLQAPLCACFSGHHSAPTVNRPWLQETPCWQPPPQHGQAQAIPPRTAASAPARGAPLACSEASWGPYSPTMSSLNKTSPDPSGPSSSCPTSLLLLSSSLLLPSLLLSGSSSCCSAPLSSRPR